MTGENEEPDEGEEIELPLAPPIVYALRAAAIEAGCDCGMEIKYVGHLNGMIGIGHISMEHGPTCALALRQMAWLN